MIRAFTYLQACCLTLPAHDPTGSAAVVDRRGRSRPRRGDRDLDRGFDRGQATTEYALVMLGASAIALLVITWATAGGGAGRVGRLFDRVIDAVIGRI